MAKYRKIILPSGHTGRHPRFTEHVNLQIIFSSKLANLGIIANLTYIGYIN